VISSPFCGFAGFFSTGFGVVSIFIVSTALPPLVTQRISRVEADGNLCEHPSAAQEKI
jgi:hypothetical protein